MHPDTTEDRITTKDRRAAVFVFRFFWRDGSSPAFVVVRAEKGNIEPLCTALDVLGQLLMAYSLKIHSEVITRAFPPTRSPIQICAICMPNSFHLWPQEPLVERPL